MTPPRLHVMTATACNLAVVLSRGPSGQVASLLWNRASGDVTLGQWLKGRIFEHRSDISPDGRHMIYFAGKGGRYWTAISRAPWLTALSFLPQSHAWCGGGAFTPQGRVFLNGAGAPSGLPDRLRPADPSAYPHGTDGFHMGALYPAMMEARGWTAVAGASHGTVMEKPAAKGWRLRLSFEIGAANRAMISNRYALIGPSAEGDPVVEGAGWEWAEPWAGGLQIARDGALLFLPLGEDGPGEARPIHGFTDMRFAPRAAPYRGVRA